MTPYQNWSKNQDVAKYQSGMKTVLKDIGETPVNCTTEL